MQIAEDTSADRVRHRAAGTDAPDRCDDLAEAHSVGTRKGRIAGKERDKKGGDHCYQSNSPVEATGGRKHTHNIKMRSRTLCSSIPFCILLLKSQTMEVHFDLHHVVVGYESIMLTSNSREWIGSIYANDTS